jgi:hypothetical protein
MTYSLECYEHALDDFGLEVLLDIHKKSSYDPPCLFDILNIPCVKSAIALYNKILELENNNYLNLRVDTKDCRVQYVHISKRGYEVIARIHENNHD